MLANKHGVQRGLAKQTLRPACKQFDGQRRDLTPATCCCCRGGVVRLGPLAVPSKDDPIIGESTAFGNHNESDVVAFNQNYAFKRDGCATRCLPPRAQPQACARLDACLTDALCLTHRPLSKFVLYKAWYYDGEWHDPGELKGIQAWCVLQCPHAWRSHALAPALG